MDETTYRALLAEFLNDYWGAFHEALEAQTVNPEMLADSLFNALVAAHHRFAAARNGVDPAVERLGRLWRHLAERRSVTFEAPLSAHEVEHALFQPTPCMRIDHLTGLAVRVWNLSTPRRNPPQAPTCVSRMLARARLLLRGHFLS